MFHVKRFTISALFLFLFSGSFAQYTNYSFSSKQEPLIKIAIDEEINRKVLSGAKEMHLNDKEKELLYWMNFARKYPRRFYDEVVFSYLKAYPELMEDKKYVKTLKNDLYSSPSLPIFITDARLTAMAREHAVDVKKNSPSIGHTSSSGLDFMQRAKKYGLNVYLAENLSYGASSVLMQLVLLYLDIDQPGLGHRKNLLNPLYTNIGIALVVLDDKNIFFVQDFSSSPDTRH